MLKTTLKVGGAEHIFKYISYIFKYTLSYYVNWWN